MRFAPAILLAAVFAGLAVAACAVTPITQPTPEGQLAVLRPDVELDLYRTDTDWVIIGDGQHRISLDVQSAMPGLIVSASAEPLVAVRRLQASLLATPYLSWAWNLENAGPGLHPLRLVVGFNSHQKGATKPWPWETLATNPEASPLPAHNRALALVWGETPLRRGYFHVPPLAKDAVIGTAPLYTVRGGAENTGTWWLETVDLAALYGEAWPEDARAGVAVVFIGFATAPAPGEARGRVSGILLSH